MDLRLPPLLTSPLFHLGRQGISLLWLLQALALLLLLSLLARAFKHLLRDRVLVLLRIREGRREAIATLTAFAVAAFGTVAVAQGMGLDFGALAVVLGALGVGIGFGLQDLSRNLTSGLTLLMEGKLKVGDLIEFSDTIGTIKEISIRSTVIRTFAGSEIIVPNSSITNSPVRNLSYRSSDGRVEVKLTVEHGSDVLEVTELLLQAAALEPCVIHDPPAKVIFAGLGETGLSFELWVWTGTIDSSLAIRSSLHYTIERLLRRRGIFLASGTPALRTLVAALQVQPNPAPALSPDPPHPPHPPPAGAAGRPLHQLLPDLPCFAGIGERPLRELIAAGARRELAPGEVLVRQGEEGTGFALVLEGRVGAIFETERISRRLFCFEAGQFFGELPLLLKVPYPTTMRAEAPTTLFVLHPRGFQALLQRHPAFGEQIARELGRRREVLRSYESCLRERGLLDDLDLNDPLAWVRERLGRLLAFRSPSVVDEPVSPG